MAEPMTSGRWGRILPLVAMLAGVLAWLWPIGLGGEMLVGGDPTQFSMGIMAFLRTSLVAGRLPLWNDLWGFGFPGVAESQMGVYYPPHLVLYRSFPTEVAYTLSLVLHTLWGALGARWAARRFGVSEVGSALAGFTFATSGMALIHLPHQWAYTLGSWMPWVWGLTWVISQGEGTRRTPWLLSAVLTIQVLPGHFQLAFVTEVGAIVLALASGRRAIRASVVVGLALAGMVSMGAMQLWPTIRLSRLSDSDRDFGYLSSFAATPLHLISYVAPGLFHWSPLWRALAWDKLRTAPEEHLAYIGLVPLFLALSAIVRGLRRESAVRTLTVLSVVTLLLSLGPYVPGFSTLIKLPGFSFFRAPARWGLGTSLSLSILAGLGFDGCGTWLRPARSTLRFAFGAVGAVLVLILGFELALAASRETGPSPISTGFDQVLKTLAWTGRPVQTSFRSIMVEAYRPRDDLRTQTALARSGATSIPPPGPSLAGSRFAIYRQELGDSGLLILGLVAASSLAPNRRGAFAGALLALTLTDALLLSRHRPFDLGPVRPLAEQSTSLARLAREPRGSRTLDPAQNLFQIAGAAPASAYRTLDLPSPVGLLAIARGPADDPRSTEALRAAGIGLLVLDASESRPGVKILHPGWDQHREVIADPALAGWLYGVDLARVANLRGFTMIWPSAGPTQAWLVSSKDRLMADGMADPRVILDVLGTAAPLPIRPGLPEEAEVDVKLANPGDSMVVLSRTFDPEWDAWWTNSEGDRRTAEVVRVLGGWQGVRIPEPGRWTLHLHYSGRAARLGITISSIAWSVWMMVYWRLGKPRSPEDKESDG